MGGFERNRSDISSAGCSLFLHLTNLAQKVINFSACPFSHDKTQYNGELQEK